MISTKTNPLFDQGEEKLRKIGRMPSVTYFSRYRNVQFPSLIFTQHGIKSMDGKIQKIAQFFETRYFSFPSLDLPNNDPGRKSESIKRQ